MINVNKTNLQLNDSPPQDNHGSDIINGHGIHDTLQIMLVGLLIIASVTVVCTTNSEIHQHDRYLRTYFNLNLLGKNDLSDYEQGLNIDQCQMQFATIQEIQEHFTKMINITNSIEQDGMVLFKNSQDVIIQFQLQSRNNQFNITQFYAVEQAFRYFNDFQTASLKKWLLSSHQFKFRINLGENKFVDNFWLVGEYELHSLMMIKIKLDTEYKLRSQRQIKLNGLRVVQQVLASTLFIVYLYQAVLLSRNSKNHHLLKNRINISQSVIKQYRNWYMFLQLMTLIIIISQKYAPICAFLQILPIFQFPERQTENQSEVYNFNRNIRFSFPLILSIFFQLVIVLNGFILYSMLMYPGEYFDDYSRGFFSYIYQMFQVGTYEIFTQLQTYGNFAQMLYAFLYFYVFQVGNALVPALFVILIEIKLTQRFLKKHVSDLAHQAACPQCLEKNSHLIDSKNVHIVINSPKLSPFIDRERFADKEKQQQTLMLYIQQSQNHQQQQNSKFHNNTKFANYSRRIMNTMRKLQINISKNNNQDFLRKCLSNIQRMQQHQQQ